MNPKKKHIKLYTIIILIFAFTLPFALNALNVVNGKIKIHKRGKVKVQSIAEGFVILLR